MLVLSMGLGRQGVAGAPECADDNGDSNGDNALDLSDAVYLLSHLFQGGPAAVLFCDPAGPKEEGCAAENGDSNGDNALDLSDGIYLLGHLFQGGLPPVDICENLAGPEAGNCNDGVDNDGDTFTDCDDPDCAGAFPQFVYTFDSDPGEWGLQQCLADITLALDNGALVMTYEEAVGSPHPPGEQLDTSGIRIQPGFLDPGIDTSTITHVTIDYQAVNWPTSDSVRCFMGYLAVGNPGGSLEFPLDPLGSQVVIDLTGEMDWTDMPVPVTGINLEMPFGDDAAATPASDWYTAGAELHIDRIALTLGTNPPAPCPPAVGSPEVCDNGTDDDLDGLVDCADADCPHASQVVYTFDAALEGWMQGEGVSDNTAVLDGGDGTLVVTYRENPGVGDPNGESGPLDFPGISNPTVSIDNSTITHVTINYEALNWPTSTPVRATIGYGGSSEFALDPDSTEAVIDLNALRVASAPSWTGATNPVTRVIFQIPMTGPQGDCAATPASDWYVDNPMIGDPAATLRIDRIAFTSASASCP